MSVKEQKPTPGIGGVNVGSGRNMTHEKRPDQNIDHNAHRQQQQKPRESKKDGNQ